MKSPFRYRPLPVRAVNLAGTALRGAGFTLAGLDPGALLETARRRTGLTDFGNEDFRAPFETLLGACERQAKLSLVGRLAARSHLLQLLETRLRMHCDRQNDPRIAEQTIVRPVFLTGLPRSGTTLLHGMLACDPANRTPLTWEVMFPSPPPATVTDEARIRTADGSLRWLDRLAPAFKRIHPVGALLPQECIAITAHNFTSIEFHTLWRVPDYQAWFERDDPRRAYFFHRRFLQHLQRGRPGGRWVLKAPAHLFDLGSLFAVYPDARLVQMHRDPREVVASVASHGTVLRSAFSDAVDPCEVGAWWCEYWAHSTDRALDYRKAHPQLAVIDLHFADLCADPITTARRLYEQLDMVLSPVAENAMRGFLAEYPKGRYGEHHYDLAQFGLETQSIGKRFARYCEAFDLCRPE